MSITDGKVRLYLHKRRNLLVLGSLLVIQFVLTVVLSVSLAAHIIWPESAKGATPTPMQISYEGRLTDSSGNALGGTGTAYCFRFSIYDAASAGNKLWPGSATPNFTLATSTDGVFSATIGSADTLTSSVFDFSTTSTAYLQVDVSSAAPTCSSGYESLTPRQPILASPYAMTASNLGSSLRADTTGGPTGGAVVRVGAGTGAATPVYMDLDWKNTVDYVGQSCSVNGQMWYNSNVAISQAFICENGTIAGLGINGTTTIAAITANAGTPATIGTVNFNNGNGVTFGINGNTITASVAAAGGGGTLSQWEPYSLATNTQVSSPSTQIFFNTFNLPNPLAISKVNILKSFNFGVPTATSTASTGSEGFSYTQGFSIFTRQDFGANSTNLSYLTSGSFGMTVQYLYSGVNSTSNTQSMNASWVTNSTGGTSGFNSATSNVSNASTLASLWTGLKYMRIPLVTTLTAGEYWIGMRQSSTTASSNSNITIVSVSNMQVSMAALSLGNFGSGGALAGWHPGKQGVGSASVFTTNATMAMSVITSGAPQFPYMNFVNF